MRVTGNAMNPDNHAPDELYLAGTPLDQINPLDRRILENPDPYLARLRQEAPVYRDPFNGIVSVSTYDLILEVNRQPAIFSNEIAAPLRAGSSHPLDPDELEILKKGFWPKVDTLLTADPPAHTRYKKLAMKGFTFRRVEGMGDYIAKVTNELLDEIAPRGKCDLRNELTGELTMTVIADQLGVPREDIPRLHGWTEARVVQMGGISDKAKRLEAARKILEFQQYFAARIEEKRRKPGEDIISDLVHANLAEDGDVRTLTPAELVSILEQLLVAGNDTTAHTMAAGIYFLLMHPDQLKKVLDDESLIPGFIEETLRYLTVANSMWRRVKQDAQIGGFPVRKGDLLLVRYGSANRDSAHFPEPDRFDVERANAREHLAFGAGLHGCVGNQLARKEMRVAYPIILRRLRNLRLQDRPDSFRYAANVILKGVAQLHVEFDPEAAAP
jgi:cytochrome P450